MDGFRRGDRSPSTIGNSQDCPTFHFVPFRPKGKTPSNDWGFKSRGE
jgi:hypothetical protein